jgi:hypothetical protein
MRLSLSFGSSWVPFSCPVITKSEIPDLMLAACPSFRPGFAQSRASHGDDQLYTHASALVTHLLALHRTGQRDEFPAVGEFIERLHAEGDHEVRTLATIGFLEGIQNSWVNDNTDPAAFLPFLGPLSTKAWHDLNSFWSGEAPFVPDNPNA